MGAVSGFVTISPYNDMRWTSQPASQGPEFTTRMRRDLRTGAQDTLCQK